MKESQLIELIEGALEVADKASQKVLEVYHSEDSKFESKKDGSPVTEADIASHHILNKGLVKLNSKIPILSEEGNDNAMPDESLFWLIDPLDGTKEFINRNGEFTVNIALIEQGAPILGIIFSPAVEENFYGAINLGAFKVSGTERTNILPTKQTKDECRVTISKSHKSKGDEWFIDECKKRFGIVHEIPTGSSLKLCKVAEGKADIYSRLGPTYQWDIAAGQAVVESAGGVVNDLSGSPLSYKFDPELKNPHFYCAGDKEFLWLELFKEN
jgi:3'(2'), 5'-bisphosphate nucleotidase